MQAELDLRLADAVRSWLAEAEASGMGARDYTALLAQIIQQRGPR